MSILAGYIIIVFLFFLGFSLFDFIAYNSNFNLKKAIKHPFSLFFCFFISYDNRKSRPFVLYIIILAYFSISNANILA
jgi:hypothetical protein